MVKLVQFSNGKFGIQRGIIFKDYLSHSKNWYRDKEVVNEYCQFDTDLDAINTLHQLLEEEIPLNPKVIRRV